MIQGNVLDNVLHLLSGIDYRVDIIGDVPAGFAMDQAGNYSYFSERSEAFVMHYDLVLPDTETRVGRLFENEIRSRGALAISLKNQLTRDVRSLDPNDIIGPAGYGDEKWVSAAELLNYTIRFENDPLEATSAAHSVEVTQVLDSDLDLNSFRFGNFGFGGRLYEVPDRVQQFSQRIDLLEEMGIFVEVFATLEHASRSVTWIFRSITSSGNFTSDPNDGFLPLNNTPPEGDGFVSYSVRAKRTASAGSRLDASARIIFDGNAPLDTSTIFNTLDPASPTSLLVGDIVMQSDNRMLVSWDGTDGEVGAGVSHYNVYVSQDGKQFELWLDSTDLLKAEYAGEPGTRYEFLTIAEDHVGNLESEIKLPDSGRPHAYAGGTYEGVEGETLTLIGIGTDPNEGQTVRFEWDLDYDGLSFTVDSTAQNPNLTLPDGPGQRTVALRVWDNGNVPLVSPISIATISIANAAPVIEVTQTSIRGSLQTTLRNTGTWSDFPGDIVTLTTNLGTVDLATDGTWQWSFPATTPLQNVPVTVTATDEDGDQNSINFTITTGSIPVEAVITPVNSTGLTYGEQLELEIIVQPTIASNLVPNGQVQIFVNLIPYGDPIALSMGKVTALIADLAAGTNTITADYLDPSSTHELTEPGRTSITIEKAVLTIRANDATTRAGRELPVLDYVVEGFQYDDDDTTAFTGKPQLGVASDVPKYPGEFPINVTVGDLQSSNYEFAFVAGTIFVGWTWTNPYVAYDVNADDSVTPIDALIIMNYLNRGGQTSLQDPDQEPSRFYDVNGDRTVTPIDALRIINYLNRRTGTGGEGEERPSLMGTVDNIDSNAATEAWDDEKKRRIQLIDQAFGNYEG